MTTTCLKIDILHKERHEMSTPISKNFISFQCQMQQHINTDENKNYAFGADDMLLQSTSGTTISYKVFPMLRG